VPSSYAAVYEQWRRDPEGFWGAAAGAIDWESPPRTICDRSRQPFMRWFADGRVNACYNAIDRHVESGHGSQPALIWVSAMTGAEEIFTFAQVQERVARLAGALRKLGVRAGDRVVIDMPMVPEAVFAMLACARIGAIHSVVFGGFAARELAARIDDAAPKLVLAASCGLEPGRTVDYRSLLDQALGIARHRPERCIVLQRPHHRATLAAERDLDWHALVAEAPPVECVDVEATHPLYVLYTSGTTGKPKGIVRDTGGYLVALAWSMRNVYGASPGEVYWAASDIGWVVGHSYIVYGPLVHRCTTVLYEGKPVGTPDAGAYWRIVAKHGVRTLFTAPTAIRAIKREDPEGKFLRVYDTSPLRALFLAGERADPDTVRWTEARLRVAVIDHWWQTETGWPMVANCLGIERLPVKAGSPSKPVPGYDVRVLDARDRRAPRLRGAAYHRGSGGARGDRASARGNAGRTLTTTRGCARCRCARRRRATHPDDRRRARAPGPPPREAPTRRPGHRTTRAPSRRHPDARSTTVPSHRSARETIPPRRVCRSTDPPAYR
jgi:propionyl-CoA synthetase